MSVWSGPSPTHDWEGGGTWRRGSAQTRSRVSIRSSTKCTIASRSTDASLLHSHSHRGHRHRTGFSGCRRSITALGPTADLLSHYIPRVHAHSCVVSPTGTWPIILSWFTRQGLDPSIKTWPYLALSRVALTSRASTSVLGPLPSPKIRSLGNLTPDTHTMDNPLGHPLNRQSMGIHTIDNQLGHPHK